MEGRIFVFVLGQHDSPMLNKQESHGRVPSMCGEMEGRPAILRPPRCVGPGLKQQQRTLFEAATATFLQWRGFGRSSSLLHVCAVFEQLLHLICPSATRCGPKGEGRHHPQSANSPHAVSEP